MMDMSVTPTEQAHRELANAFDALNQRLFDGELPRCLITLQRNRASRGYFAAHRFIRTDATTTHEIAINPQIFALATLPQVLGELAHNMAHLWAHLHGQQGRRGYHSKGWATKMEELGLMPSSTGAPGGKTTGEKVEHYILPGGRFESVAHEMVAEGFNITWLDRIAAPWREDAGATSSTEGDDPILGRALLKMTGLLVSHNLEDDAELAPVTDGPIVDAAQEAPEASAAEATSPSNRDSSAPDDSFQSPEYGQEGDAADESFGRRPDRSVEPTGQVLLDSGVKPRSGQESKSVPLIAIGGENINGGSTKRRQDKVRFTCPQCKQKAWAKGTAVLDCGNCKEPMVASELPAPE